MWNVFNVFKDILGLEQARDEKEIDKVIGKCYHEMHQIWIGERGFNRKILLVLYWRPPHYVAIVITDEKTSECSLVAINGKESVSPRKIPLHVWKVVEEALPKEK